MQTNEIMQLELDMLSYVPIKTQSQTGLHPWICDLFVIAGIVVSLFDGITVFLICMNRWQFH